MIVSGETPTLGKGFLGLAYLPSSAAVRLLVGVAVAWLDAVSKTVPSKSHHIWFPMPCNLAAEAIHAPESLPWLPAVCNLSQKSSEFFSARVRIQAWAVWMP